MGYELKLVRRPDGPRDGQVLDVGVSLMPRLRQVMRELDMVAVAYGQEDVPTEVAHDAYTTRLGRRPENDFEILNSPKGAERSVWRPPLLDSGGDAPQAGIAVHKLSSNGMWWVTREECRESLDAWHRALAASLPDGRSASRTDERRLVAGALAHPVDSDDPDVQVVNQLNSAWDMVEAPSCVSETAWIVDFWFPWLAFLEAAADENGFDVW